LVSAMKTSVPALPDTRLTSLIFDIVNGFFDRCREASRKVSNRRAGCTR
jgi:hypothetical protein